MVISGEGGQDVERMLGHMILQAHKNAGVFPGKPNTIEIKNRDEDKNTKYLGTDGDGSTTLAIGPQPEVEEDTDPEEEDSQMNQAAFNIMQNAGLPLGVTSDNSIAIMPKGKFKCRACNLGFQSKQMYGKHRKTE